MSLYRLEFDPRCPGFDDIERFATYLQVIDAKGDQWGKKRPIVVRFDAQSDLTLGEALQFDLRRLGHDATNGDASRYRTGANVEMAFLVTL